MEKLGLAWNVIRIAPERQEARLAGARTGSSGELHPAPGPLPDRR
jgi:hypothetical protein